MAMNERMQKSRSIRETIGVKDVSPYVTTDIYTNFASAALNARIRPRLGRRFAWKKEMYSVNLRNIGRVSRSCDNTCRLARMWKSQLEIARREETDEHMNYLLYWIIIYVLKKTLHVFLNDANCLREFFDDSLDMIVKSERHRRYNKCSYKHDHVERRWNSIFY